jgi:hypothetical protein
MISTRFYRQLFVLIILAVAILLRFGRSSNPTLPAVPSTPPSPQATSTNRLYPDLRLTPGVTDPRVNQANIGTTVCMHGYTRSVRPPFEWSNRLKHEVMESYRVTGSIHDYELDHFIPLELGGCPDCIANLWPQPWASPGAKEKDDVERYLHNRVCAGSLSLGDAQKAITQDWYAIYRALPH